jgi:hypothetical protein
VQLEEVNSKCQFNGLPAELVFHLSDADVLNSKKKKKKKKRRRRRRRRKEEEKEE